MVMKIHKALEMTDEHFMARWRAVSTMNADKISRGTPMVNAAAK